VQCGTTQSKSIRDNAKALQKHIDFLEDQSRKFRDELNETRRLLKVVQDKEIDADQAHKDEIFSLKEKLARSERARNEAWETSEKEKLNCERKMNELRKVRATL
jgi:predicted  nucleic acid-binding Zn-ribbon protein